MDKARKTIIDIMDNYVSAKNLTEAQALEVLKLPMLVVYDEDDTLDSKMFNDALDQKLVELHQLPFEDATYWIRNFALYRLTILPDKMTDTTMAYRLTNYIDPGTGNYKNSVYAVVDFELALDRSSFKIVYIGEPNGRNGVLRDHATKQEFISTLEMSCLFSVCAISEFLNKCASTDRSAVVRTPSKIVPRTGSKTVNKLKQAYDNGPKVCYLRTMPTPSDPTGMLTGIKLKPHQRIKHTKTLKHERYRNHPMYQVKDGIEIDTYWVGEKTAEFQGNIYRLLEN